MRTLIISLLITMWSIQAHAQFYKVYTVKGNVTFLNKPVESGHLLHGDWVISIPEKGKLVLLDSRNDKILTIKSSGRGTVSSFIKNKDTKGKQVTDKYMTFIFEKATTKHLVDPSLYMQTSGNVVRRPAGEDSDPQIILPSEE